VALAELPPDVSLPTAETVLFIGKAVRVLKQPMSSAASHQALRAHAEILGFSQALHRLQRQEAFSAVQFDHCIEAMRAKVLRRPGWAGWLDKVAGLGEVKAVSGWALGRQAQSARLHAANLTVCPPVFYSHPSLLAPPAILAADPVLCPPSHRPPLPPTRRCLGCCGTWCSTAAT
jgi:hypothetical protein